MNEHFEIPLNWKIVTLEDIAEGKNAIVDGPFGSNLKTSDYIDDNINGVPVLTTKNLEGDYSDRKVRFISKIKFEELKRSQVNPGDILVAKIGSIGKTGIYPKNARVAIIPANLLKFTVSKKVDFNYVFYYLNSRGFQNRIKRISTATAQPAFNVTKFRKLLIPLPPLPTQLVIVSKIEELFSELDKGIENLRLAQQQLKTYRQSVLKWAFEGRLTNENIKERELPEGWKLNKLGEIAEKIFDGPFGSNLKSVDYIDEGVRVIRLENIGVLTFKDEFKTFVSNEKYLSIQKHTVSSGDIIFSSFIIGEIRVTILPKFIIKAINKADCFCIRVSQKKINNNYLTYFLSTKNVYNQLIEEVHGATRPRINTTQLKSCLIPYCSIEEQNKIVQEIESRLSVADKMEENITQSLKQAEVLRQSILKKAFQGKLIN